MDAFGGRGEDRVSISPPCSKDAFHIHFLSIAWEEVLAELDDIPP